MLTLEKKYGAALIKPWQEPYKNLPLYTEYTNEEGNVYYRRNISWRFFNLPARSKNV